MRKCIFFFFCVCALASCSPKTFCGVRDARAFEHAQLLDSVSVRCWLDARLQEYAERSFERAESLRTETVREVFSDPDTLGRQHLVERSVTRSVSGTSTRAASQVARATQLQEHADSVAVADSCRVEVAEIREEIEQEPSPRASWPWYKYVAGLAVALLLGLFLGGMSKRWRAVR